MSILALSLAPRHLAFLTWGLLLIIMVVVWVVRWILDDTR